MVFNFTLVVLFSDSSRSDSRSLPFSYLNVSMLDLWQGQLEETCLVSNLCLQRFLFFGEKDSEKRSEEFAPLQYKPKSLNDDIRMLLGGIC